MITVEEARGRILSALSPLPAEIVSVAAAAGRVLAEDVTSRVTQPPADVSAMDGWAVRAADLTPLPAGLKRIGTAPAGAPFPGRVGAGEAVRIFTGGVVPAGADTVVLQEDCEETDGTVTVRDGGPAGRWIRPKGLDFAAGVTGLAAGRRLTARDIALAAAMNVPWLAVRRRPRVAILATGDEIARPGEPLGDGRIVSSNALALAAFITARGGQAIDLGIAPDDERGLARFAAGAEGMDLLVTTGGASVGEHDLVRKALQTTGLHVDFWKIAMRPGKPLMFGRHGTVPMLGLPGNPVSTLVCALLFLEPALRALQGLPPDRNPLPRARLATSLAENDRREDYLRATLTPSADGLPEVSVFAKQDSSMLSLLARADCLVRRPPHAAPAAAGETVEYLPLDPV